MENTRSSEFEGLVNDLREVGLIARLSKNDEVYGGVEEVGEGITRRTIKGAFDVIQEGDVLSASVSLPNRQIPLEFTGNRQEVVDWIVKQLKPK